MNLYKKCATKPYFLLSDTALASDNPVRFRCNLLERIQTFVTSDDKIRDGKLHYGINIEVAKILALSSGKVDKYEYCTVEEILPSPQSQILEEAKFTHSPLGRAFKKQIKMTDDHSKKQRKVSEEHENPTN